MNRKKSAVQAYRALESLNLKAPILLLSGWVTPYRRRIILRYLKWLEKKERRHYLAATQVVEAGVDLDFSWVLEIWDLWTALFRLEEGVTGIPGKIAKAKS